MHGTGWWRCRDLSAVVVLTPELVSHAMRAEGRAGSHLRSSHNLVICTSFLNYS